jgi:VWFA-related protein
MVHLLSPLTSVRELVRRCGVPSRCEAQRCSLIIAANRSLSTGGDSHRSSFGGILAHESMRLSVSIATVLVFYAAFGISARDRVPTAAAQAQDAPVFSVRSELVVLDVLVRDNKNAYTTGLTQEAFTVEEDGVRQAIRFFAESDAPATVGLIIDSSGSMADAREDVVAAVGAFAETSNPEDEIFALTFNDRVRPALPSTTQFTGNHDVLRTALTNAFRPWGRTALYDALEAGFEYLDKGMHQRKALVLVSDGGDNASRASLDQVIGMVESSSTVIHTVALSDSGERDANPKLLKRLAETSGGNAFRPGRPGQVRSALRLIADDIRSSYTIGYVSTNAVLDGRLRRVRVTAEVPGRRSLRVRTRQGYVAR